jgi:GntR family transcriptional regulator
MAAHGVLAPDSQLWSVRQLAAELSINPNTIQRAYRELEHRGVTYSIQGKGSFISGDCDRLRQRKLEEIKEQVCTLLHTARELGADESTLQDWFEEGRRTV